MHSLSRGRIVGYTVSVSVSISALSGGYVPDTGIPQSSLSTGLCDLCMVVGRLLGDFLVGSCWIVLLWCCWWVNLLSGGLFWTLLGEEQLQSTQDCAISANWLTQSSQNVLCNLCELTRTEQPKWSVQTDSHSGTLRPKIQSGIFLEIEILFSSQNFLSWGNFGHQILATKFWPPNFCLWGN